MPSQARQELEERLRDVEHLLALLAANSNQAVLARAGIVVLSAQLDGFVRDLFRLASSELLNTGVESLEVMQDAALKGFNNPSPGNIDQLFVRIGFEKVASDPAEWTPLDPANGKSRMESFVQLRNRLAHGGRVPISADQLRDALSLVRGFADVLDREVAWRLAIGFQHETFWGYQYDWSE